MGEKSVSIILNNKDKFNKNNDNSVSVSQDHKMPRIMGNPSYHLKPCTITINEIIDETLEKGIVVFYEIQLHHIRQKHDVLFES